MALNLGMHQEAGQGEPVQEGQTEKGLLLRLVAWAEASAASFLKLEKEIAILEEQGQEVQKSIRHIEQAIDEVQQEEDQAKQLQEAKPDRELGRAAALRLPEPGWPDSLQEWGCNRCKWAKTGCPKCNSSMATFEPAEKKPKRTGEL